MTDWVNSVFDEHARRSHLRGAALARNEAARLEQQQRERARRQAEQIVLPPPQPTPAEAALRKGIERTLTSLALAKACGSEIDLEKAIAELEGALRRADEAAAAAAAGGQA